MFKLYRRLIIPLFLTFIFIFIDSIFSFFVDKPNEFLRFFQEHSRIFVIIFISWTLFIIVKLLKAFVLSKYDITVADNLESRKVHTQINILEKIVLFVIGLFAVGMILLSFEKIREIGVGLFASAGLAGIIIGLSAQRVVGAILAGLQIAFTQPFRIDDAVLVENEYGNIEEINLTYVVVRIWDKRRLILPSTYFLDKPFQNWTLTSADLIGSIFIYTDYSVPLSALREELTRLLEASELWDRQTNIIQVTNAKENGIELRVLVSSGTAPKTWDLRVHIREKLIEFIQHNYPQSFPKTRISMQQDNNSPV